MSRLRRQWLPAQAMADDCTAVASLLMSMLMSIRSALLGLAVCAPAPLPESAVLCSGPLCVVRCVLLFSGTEQSKPIGKAEPAMGRAIAIAWDRIGSDPPDNEALQDRPVDKLGDRCRRRIRSDPIRSAERLS